MGFWVDFAKCGTLAQNRGQKSQNLVLAFVKKVKKGEKNSIF